MGARVWEALFATHPFTTARAKKATLLPQPRVRFWRKFAPSAANTYAVPTKERVNYKEALSQKIRTITTV